jgi:cystathionine beta-lyase/cystathionine gamma-synthase
MVYIVIKMVWFETPTNPTLKLIDIKAICDIAKSKNPNIIKIVDNTFASSYFQVKFAPVTRISNRVLKFYCA